MKACKLRQHSEQMIWDGSAREVVDEPSHLRTLLHPIYKTFDIGIREMMREKRADNQVGGLAHPVGEHVASDPVNAMGSTTRFCRNRCRIRIQIEPSEFRGHRSEEHTSELQS